MLTKTKSNRGAVRATKNIQPEFPFQLPSSAKVTDEYFAAYEAMSDLIDGHPEIVTCAHRDLRKPLARARRRAPQGQNCTYSTDTILRMCIVKVLENLSLRRTIVRVDDSPRLRWFTRIYNAAMMDFSTFNKLANVLKPRTWKKLNQLLAKAAASEGLITGEKLRIDTTAVETNIHWPTDSGLLWDVYRVVERAVQRIRTIHPEFLSDKRLHRKRAKRLHSKISRASQHRSEKSRLEQKGLYERLIRLVSGILAWAPEFIDRARRELNRNRVGFEAGLRIEGLLEEIEHFLPLGEQAVDQATRRVLHEEKVPNDEKIFSIFEPHTELLKRGRAGKPVEFGHMISIQQVQGKFITDYAVFEKKPVEHELVRGAIDSHKELFGHVPDVLAADKGFWEDRFATERLRWEIDLVAIAKKGSRTEEERALERSRRFREAQNFRAGVEGSISFLKVTLGLWRCMKRGFERFESTVASTVFAHNLLNLARERP